MEYETPDGSQFLLMEVWNGEKFEYTNISAYVDGRPFTGRIEQKADKVDHVDIIDTLELVPLHCIYPLFEGGLTLAPLEDATENYLKIPSYTWDDCRHGQTFVADCVMNEVRILERLKHHPHPHIVKYYGCIVSDGRITSICLQRYEISLVDFVESYEIDDATIHSIMGGLTAAVAHLHGLGLAHNDINPDNVCIDTSNDRNVSVLIDFDSCMPFGEALVKGDIPTGEPVPQSAPGNDIHGLCKVEEFLRRQMTLELDEVLDKAKCD